MIGTFFSKLWAKEARGSDILMTSLLRETGQNRNQKTQRFLRRPAPSILLVTTRGNLHLTPKIRGVTFYTKPDVRATIRAV